MSYPCPCGEVHEFAHQIRGQVDRLMREMGPLIEVEVIDGTGRIYQVPRIWIAAHGLEAAHLQELASIYAWRRVR